MINVSRHFFQLGSFNFYRWRQVAWTFLEYRRQLFCWLLVRAHASSFWKWSQYWRSYFSSGDHFLRTWIFFINNQVGFASNICWMRYGLVFYHFGVIGFVRGLFFLKFCQRFILSNHIFIKWWFVVLFCDALFGDVGVYLVSVFFGGISKVIVEIKLHWFLYPCFFLGLFELSKKLQLKALAGSESFARIELQQSLEKRVELRVYQWKIIRG